MKTCPYCREQIHAEAAKCPRCQTTFTKQEMSAGQQERRGNARGKIVIAVAAIAALIWWLDQPGSVEGLGEWAAKQEASTP